MARSAIEWTDATWNPVTGFQVASVHSIAEPSMRSENSRSRDRQEVPARKSVNTAVFGQRDGRHESPQRSGPIPIAADHLFQCSNALGIGLEIRLVEIDATGFQWNPEVVKPSA